MEASGEPIHVVQFVNTLSERDGGPARHALQLNLALNEIGGVAVRLVEWSAPTPDSLAAEYSSSVTELPELIRLGVTRAGVMGVFTRIRTAAALIRTADVVVVHGYLLLWVPAVVGTSRLARTPVVLMPHGSLNHFEATRGRAKRVAWSTVFGWWVDRSVSVFAVASPSEAQQVEAGRRVRSAVAVGGGAVLQHRVREDRAPATPARLLMLGRIAAKKRADIAIAAVVALARRGKDVTLTIAGVGDQTYVEDLRSQARMGGVADHVHFVGHVSGAQKLAAYRDHDAYLAPSEDENFGIAVADAMVAGLPTVATTGVDCASMVQARGLIVLDKPNADAVADAVEQLLCAPDFADLSADLSRAASAAFSWHGVAARWRSLLQRVVGR